MEVLNTVFLIVIIISALCIIGLVLVQKSKAGGGLGGLASTGGGMDEAFGTQTASVLTKATVFFITLFFIATVSIGLNQRVLKIKAGTSLTDSGIETPADDKKDTDDSKTDDSKKDDSKKDDSKEETDKTPGPSKEQNDK